MWNNFGHPNAPKPVKTVIDPQRNGIFEQLAKIGIRFDVLTHNLEELIEKERQHMLLARQKHHPHSRAFDYENTYHTYQEIIDQIKQVAQENPSMLFAWFQNQSRIKNLNSLLAKSKYLTVGTTFQKREIPGIIIGDTSKPAVFLECGIHAREWVSTAFCLWTVNALLTDASLSKYVTNYQFIIVPTLNSDGYVYTHTNNRLWRKTRSTTGSTICPGADPNRKWVFSFF